MDRQVAAAADGDMPAEFFSTINDRLNDRRLLRDG
jgi:hypothetical protein